MKVRMVKLKDSDSAEYKNHIEIGTEVVGEITKLPEEGECFYVGLRYRTSFVKEIISLDIFRTNNSIYKIEKVQ